MGAPRVKCPSPLHVQQNDKIHASLYGLGIPVCVCVCMGGGGGGGGMRWLDVEQRRKWQGWL